MTIRLGLLGLGIMGRNHARVARTIEGFDLVAVADARGDPDGHSLGLPVETSIENLLGHKLDAVIVALPTALHEAAGLTLADAGIHALIEKPLAQSREAGVRLVEAFSSAGLVGAVGHIERFNPALLSMRSRLMNGDLGKVFQVQTRRQGPFPSRINDVGVMKDLGSHDVDLTAWLTQAAYTKVSAQTAHQTGRPHEDLIAITGKLNNEVVVNHLVNWLTPFKERTTLVTGERGSFLADTISGDLTYFENGTFPTTWDSVQAFRGVSEGSATRFALEKQEPLRAELEAFRDAIQGKPSEAVSLLAGLEVLSVCEAALQSAREGKTIAL